MVWSMGALVSSPLAKGMLTGRYRKGQALPESLRVKVFPRKMSNERNLEAVEHLIPIAEGAGMSLTHMAMAFVMAHPGVTSAILGPRTMQHLDDLLAGAEVCGLFARKWHLLRIYKDSIHCAFNPVSQLTTTVMGEGSFWPREDTTRIRWPSGVTS